MNHIFVYLCPQLSLVHGQDAFKNSMYLKKENLWLERASMLYRPYSFVSAIPIRQLKRSLCGKSVSSKIFIQSKIQSDFTKIRILIFVNTFINIEDILTEFLSDLSFFVWRYGEKQRRRPYSQENSTEQDIPYFQKQFTLHLVLSKYWALLELLVMPVHFTHRNLSLLNVSIRCFFGKVMNSSDWSDVFCKNIDWLIK